METTTPTTAAAAADATDASSVDWTALPRDAWLHVLATLGTPRELGKCGTVCRTSQSMVRPDANPKLWRQVAAYKYGLECADYGFNNTDCYNRNWKELLLDDNRKGALPTIDVNKTLNWNHNPNDQFCCCHVLQIKWNSAQKRIEVYLEARGDDPDRTRPRYCCIRWWSVAPATSWIPRTIWGQWKSLTAEEIPGYYKGVLFFAESDLQELPRLQNVAEGRLRLCYDDRFSSINEDMDFPTWQDITASGNPYTTPVSPFAKDNDAVEQKRWARLVLPAVWERWWAAAQRAKSE